jgi:peroxiredoxin
MATKKSDKQLWIMLALIAAILAAILLLPSCGGRTTRGTAAESADETAATTLVGVGAAAPDFTVELFDGGELTLSSLRGKVVLLNFWATWCPPCREELARVQTELIDRFAGRDFLFLPVSRGEERSAVAAFRERTGYAFPMALDPERRVYDLYATNFIPRNFLIGRDGRVVAATVGYDGEEFAELIATIEQTLEKR